MPHDATDPFAGRHSTSQVENESQFIDLYLRGERSAHQTVDGWVDVVLFEGFRSLRSEWEDLRQEIRIRVLTNLRRGRFNGHSSLRTYVHQIAKNTCIDSLRRAYRRFETEPLSNEARQTETDRPLASCLAHEIVEKVLKELTEEDRILVRLVFVEHYSSGEVAKFLRIPQGTVKSRLARCRARILDCRRELAGSEEDHG